jgi:hypothetical protein
MKWNLSAVEIFGAMKLLIAKGWRLQRPGMTFRNGTLVVDLMKDGQVLMLSQNLTPDQDWAEQQWPPGTRQVPRL